MFVARKSMRLIALFLALVLAAGACSSDSETTTDAADAGSEEASSGTEPPSGADEEVSDDEAAGGDDDGNAAYALECQEAGALSGTLRSANGLLQQINEENAGDLSPDYEGILAAIEGLRPIEDVEGPIGSMSEGLDAMEVDVAAAQAGRYEDIAGGYNISKMNGVIVDVICGN